MVPVKAVKQSATKAPEAKCRMANSCENESFRDFNAQWTGWWLPSNPRYFPVLRQNTVDKLIKKTNLALLVGTNSWRDQFIEAITVSAGKAGAEMCASTCEEAGVCVFHMNSWHCTDELCVRPIRPNPSENLVCACVSFSTSWCRLHRITADCH